MTAIRALPLWITFLGLALRIYAAVSHLDISHPDEHFQTLEPASHVIYGFGWLSWEWTMGVRSWFVPALYMPLLWILKLVGFNGGPVPIVACRALMAIASTFGMYQFWVLLCESGIKRWSGVFVLAIMALLPSFAAWGAMTLSDVWAWVFLWSALPYVFRTLNGGDPGAEKVFVAGVLLGLSFLARIQMILWPVGMVAVLVFRKPFPKKLIFQLSTGYGVVILFQGLLDWVTWGAPFHSTILNIKKNVLEGVASFYGTSPVFEYFSLIPKSIGWPIVISAIGIFLLAVILGAKRIRERDALILVPAALYLFVHSAIAHKEIRFMMPIFPAILYMAAWGLSAFEGERLTGLRVHQGLVGAAATICAIISSGFVYSTDHTYPFDLSELTLKIREDGGLAHGGCLLLLDHYWIWTRGEMMIGAPIRYIELSSGKPISNEARSCVYAITLPGRESWFSQVGGPRWITLAKDNHGQVLMKRALTES